MCVSLPLLTKTVGSYVRCLCRFVLCCQSLHGLPLCLLLLFHRREHSCLLLSQVNDNSSDGSNPPVVRTIDFVFDPEVDTADNLAAEISEEFSLSPTDTEICAAALREWLAKDMPGSDNNA